MTSSPDPSAVPDATDAASHDVGRVFGDDAAWAALGALDGPYLPWGAGSMRPGGIVEVCNDIVLNDRRRIVELGGGVSTVLYARLLAQRGERPDVRLVTVEHDPRWARWVSGQLAGEGIGSPVHVVEAALVAGGAAGWYDRDAIAAGLAAALGSDPVELLVIDGPPAYEPGHGLARYPALPALWDRLAAGATVVLDDVERRGEQAVLRRWELEYGLRFRRLVDAAGVAIATVG